MPSIRAVSRTGLTVTAPRRAAQRISPEITILAVWAPLTVFYLIATRIRSNDKGIHFPHSQVHRSPV